MNSRLVKSGTHQTIDPRIGKKPQPKLSNGIHREGIGVDFHPYIKEGLKLIGDEEKMTISRIVAQIVGEYFGIDSDTGEVLSITRFTRKMMNKR